MRQLNWINQDVISTINMEKNDMEQVFDVADTLRPVAEGREKSRALEGKILGNLFYESSTRTRLSFESAMLRLGGGCTGFADPASSRAVTKGFEQKELLDDMIRVVEKYVDIIVIRSLHDGSAELSANYASVPVINAGDGRNEHPTQALLDLYTIRHEKKNIDGLKIVQLGCLNVSRSQRSFAFAVSKYDVDLVFLSPKKYAFGRDVLNKIEKNLGHKPTVVTSSKALPTIADADVIRVTFGIQPINARTLQKAKNDLIVLHPLPRGPEVARDVDSTPHAVYFREVFNGLCTRMALLSLILGSVK